MTENPVTLKELEQAREDMIAGIVAVLAPGFSSDDWTGQFDALAATRRSK